MNQGIHEPGSVQLASPQAAPAWRAQSRRAARAVWRWGRLGRWTRRLVGCALWTSLGVLVVWVLLRLTLRDRVVSLATLYYATPPPLLGALALVVGLGLWWQRYRKGAVGGLCIAIGCAAWTYTTLWAHHRPAPADGPTCRVLFWNLAHGALGWTSIVAAIREHDADLVGLVEAGRDPQRTREYLERELPQYHVYAGRLGFALLARGPIEHKGFSLYDLALCNQFEVDLPQMRLDVALVDLAVRFHRSRGPSLRKLAAALTPLSERPLLLMGDFNTPLDSVFFDQLRRRYTNAFETAGSGYAASWPLPLPVLTLDQVWLGAALRATKCRLGTAWCSDHRWVLVEITRR